MMEGILLKRREKQQQVQFSIYLVILIGLFILYYNFPRSEYEYIPIDYTNQIG